ncbi:MAG: glycosyltransferase, partial [Clostridia bacterium]|nr:glycosyltransferase [Clostridia bacterium]
MKSKIKKIIDKKIYSKYNTLVFVSKDNKEKFENLYSNMVGVQKEVIYNYIDSNKIIEKSQKEQEIKYESDKINFLCVSRLVKQKGIDRLIKIHTDLSKKYHNVNFYVIGDGPEKSKLQELIKKNDIEGSFYLLGKKENPYPYMKNTNYLCLLSYYEGYGMVLEEAKILNKPIIITNTAAREAIEGYKNSIILENDEKSIFDGLAKIIEKGIKQEIDENQ